LDPKSDEVAGNSPSRGPRRLYRLCSQLNTGHDVDQLCCLWVPSVSSAEYDEHHTGRRLRLRLAGRSDQHGDLGRLSRLVTVFEPATRHSSWVRNGRAVSLAVTRLSRRHSAFELHSHTLCGRMHAKSGAVPAQTLLRGEDAGPPATAPFTLATRRPRRPEAFLRYGTKRQSSE
jgi:hypothetical protein